MSLKKKPLRQKDMKRKVEINSAKLAYEGLEKKYHFFFLEKKPKQGLERDSVIKNNTFFLQRTQIQFTHLGIWYFETVTPALG